MVVSADGVTTNGRTGVDQGVGAGPGRGLDGGSGGRAAQADEIREPEGHELDEHVAEYQFAPLRNRFVILRPLTLEDYPYVRQLELTADLGPRWRFRGSTPSPEQWSAMLGQTNILAHFLVMHATTHEVLGVVCVYNPDFQHGHARFAAARFPAQRRDALFLLGVVLFLDYVFHTWNFRKLYADTPEYNLSQFRSGIGRAFTLEGVLREHSYYGGRYWDEYILAVHRDRWEQRSAQFRGAQVH